MILFSFNLNQVFSLYWDWQIVGKGGGGKSVVGGGEAELEGDRRPMLGLDLATLKSSAVLIWRLQLYCIVLTLTLTIDNRDADEHAGENSPLCIYTTTSNYDQYTVYKT